MSQPTYGYHFHEDGTIKNEKEYLSYSAIDLWRKDKEAYRRRYYEGEPSFTSPYTIFGSHVHKMVEDGHMTLKKHPRDVYKNEVKIEAEIEGVHLIGYIDLFDPVKYRVSDLKTAIKPWTQVSVQQLSQLPFYQLLVKKVYGKVSQYASLVWLGTAWVDGTIETVSCGGFEMENSLTPRHLELTGQQEVFTRRIEAWERERVQDWAVKSAGEIAKDFKQWRLTA